MIILCNFHSFLVLKKELLIMKNCIRQLLYLYFQVISSVSHYVFLLLVLVIFFS